jgi:hypothetical protein
MICLGFLLYLLSGRISHSDVAQLVNVLYFFKQFVLFSHLEDLVRFGRCTLIFDVSSMVRLYFCSRSNIRCRRFGALWIGFLKMGISGL